MSNDLEGLVGDLETVDNSDRLNNILDEGYDAVEEGDATREQLDEVMRRSDEILQILNSEPVPSEEYIEGVRRKTQQYAKDIGVWNQDQVLEKADSLLEDVNPNRTVEVNAASLLYNAALLTNNRITEDGKTVTQSLISNEVSVGEKAIREGYQDILENAY